ncbi:MAG: family 16 glycosylhydrolase [Cytophagaceae bacterium]
MKKNYALLFLMIAISSVCFAQPDVIQNNGYTFVKQWTNNLDGPSAGWSIANWTFDGNLCEFGPQGTVFQNGNLNLTIDKKTAGNMGFYPNKPYWGGEYYRSEKYLYGRFVVRMKPNTPAGVVTSFFLMNIEWNHNYTVPLEWSEIDIEFSGRTDRVQFTLHWIDNQGKHMDANYVTLNKNVTDDFHEWVIEWTPTYISYYLDGTLLFTFDDPVKLQEQARPQEIHMNHWVSDAPGWVGTLDESKLPVTASYDQIIYYKLDTPTGIEDENHTALWYESQANTIHFQEKHVGRKYVIYNSSGIEVQKGDIDRTVKLNENRVKGIYLIHVIGDDKVISKKVYME